MSSNHQPKDQTTLSHPEVRLTLFPSNEGPMAPVAVAPVIACSKLQVIVDCDRRFTASLSADHFEVTSQNISPENRRRIELLVRENLLEAQTYRELHYSGRIQSQEEHPSPNEVRIIGQLGFRGYDRPFPLTFRRGGRAGLWLSEFVFRQSDFGIRPFTAFMGALRSKDEVKGNVEVDLSGCANPSMVPYR